jgi:hypothetical protein
VTQLVEVGLEADVVVVDVAVVAVVFVEVKVALDEPEEWAIE